MIRRVVVAISGGVDSAVTAYLLKTHPKKFDVVAAFMKNWDEKDEFGKCQGEEDWKDAQIVAEKLDIPIYQVNFVKQYWNEVFHDFLKDYESGLTPNPDIICNRRIKFNIFYNRAMQKFNGDAFATGHYASSNFGPYLEHYKPNTEVKLLRAHDNFKDQTFFLSQINKKALERTMFPLGSYLKSTVKEIAVSIGLNKLATKDESTGVCFIGRRNFQNFISEYIDDEPGEFIDFDTGRRIGVHSGIHKWTIGQRINISVHMPDGDTKPFYVLHKDLERRRIFAVGGTNHPALFTDVVYTGTPYWINEPQFRGDIYNGTFRFQHTKPLIRCTIVRLSTGKLFVKLEKPLRALTPGQYAVFYDGNECLGSARIILPGPSLMYNAEDQPHTQAVIKVNNAML